MKNFKMNEFKCRCCGRLPPETQGNIEALVENVLDPARERYGKPLYVNSGYRCPEHNKAVGGVPNSQHMKGEAADIRPKKLIAGADPQSPEDLMTLARIIVEQGQFDQLILYPTFLHVSWKRTGMNRKRILRKTASGYEVLRYL